MQQLRASLRTLRRHGAVDPCPGSLQSSNSSRWLFACDVQNMLRFIFSLVNLVQEMDIRLEYDKAKAVKWLMAPGLIEISAEDIATAHKERNARETAR
jgi:hypothetical protein